MAGRDEQRIDVVIVQNGLGADRCVRKPEPALRVDRSERAAGRDVHEVDIGRGRKVRKQHRRRVVAGADEADAQWSSGARDRTTGCTCRWCLDRNRARGDGRQWARILEQVADAAHAAGHQARIDLGCGVDGERVRHEGLDVEEVTGEEIDEAREISSFRPADIRPRDSRSPRARSGRRIARVRTSARSGRRAPCRSRRSTGDRGCTSRRPRPGRGHEQRAPPAPPARSRHRRPR